jgi:hypothetical protein
MRKFLLSTTALLCMTAASPAANIDLGVGDPGSVATIASGGGTASVSGSTFNQFIINLSGTGSPPLSGGVLLDGNTIDVKDTGAGPGSISVWVSSTDNNSPLGLQSLESSFTQNLLTAGWSVTAYTYADNTNTAFGTQQLLSTTTFSTSDPPDVDLLGTANLGIGPFSLSEQWLISAPGTGETNNTTDITSVPGPILGAGLPGLFAACCGMLGLNLRRKRRQLAA